MKFKSLIPVAMSLVLSAATMLPAAEAAKPAEPAKPAEAAKPAAPKVDLDALLKFVPAVVVTLDGKPALTREALLKEMKPALQQAVEQGAELKPDDVEGFAYQISENLVMRDLLIKTATAKGIKANQEAAKKQLEMMIEQTNKEAPGKFDEEVKKLGMTRDDILQKVQEQDIIQQLLKSYTANVKAPAPATVAEAQKFYDEHKDEFKSPMMLSASHILVQFPNQHPTADEKAAALKKAQQLRGQLAADGSNFAEIAKANSDCPSKKDGGDLGKFPKGSMVTEFENALVALKVGEISQPVETILGYHIIKAGETTPAGITKFDDIKDKIIAFLNNNRKQEANNKAANDAITAVKDAAKMVVNLPKPKAEAPEEAAEAPAKPADKPVPRDPES